jgi:hypothetical protein
MRSLDKMERTKSCPEETCAKARSGESASLWDRARLTELNEHLSYPQLVTLLERIEANHWKLAKKYDLSVHVVHSLERLACENKILPRREIFVFLQSKIRFSPVAVSGKMARSA